MSDARWRDAVKPAAGGVVMDVEVVPGSRESVFPAGYNAWRKRIEAKVKAPPEDGKANAELCRLAEAALGLGRVSVQSGATSRRKSLKVEGATVDQVAHALERWF